MREEKRKKKKIAFHKSGPSNLNDDVDCDIDSNIAALFTNGMGLFTIDLNNNNNLDDNKFGHLA